MHPWGVVFWVFGDPYRFGCQNNAMFLFPGRVLSFFFLFIVVHYCLMCFILFEYGFSCFTWFDWLMIIKSPHFVWEKIQMFDCIRWPRALWRTLYGAWEWSSLAHGCMHGLLWLCEHLLSISLRRLEKESWGMWSGCGLYGSIVVGVVFCYFIYMFTSFTIIQYIYAIHVCTDMSDS